MRILPNSLLVVLFVFPGCPDKGPQGDDDVADDDIGDDDTGADDDVVVDDHPESRAAAFAEHCILGDPSDPCAAAASCELRVCVETLDLSQSDYPLTGRFRQWGTTSYGVTEFEEEDGTVHDIWLWGDEEVMEVLPDLDAYGEVKVIQSGGCDGKGGFYNVFYVYRPNGDLVLLLGATGGWNVDDWSVQAPRDTTSCPAVPSDGCYEFMHNRPMEFAHGDETWSLYQGQGAVTEDGYLIWAGAAQSGSGEETCYDGPGPEYTSWFVIEDPGVEIPHEYGVAAETWKP